LHQHDRSADRCKPTLARERKCVRQPDIVPVDFISDIVYTITEGFALLNSSRSPTGEPGLGVFYRAGLLAEFALNSSGAIAKV
jgi:hypothetical protein